GDGAPLAGPVRRRMESAFRQPFGDVRVHQDGRAEAMGVPAFARGAHLHFARGAYRPESAAGRRVLGHELAHVVQQRAGRVAETGRVEGVATNVDPALETEAHRQGSRAADHVPSSPASATVASAPAAAAPEGGVAQGFLPLLAAGVGIAGLGLGAYGLYRWMRGGGNNAANQRHDEDEESDDDAPGATAEERMDRWRQRGEARKARGRLPTGRYQTPTGPVTVSGLWGQRMTQGRMEDYDDETFGSVPPYSGIRGLPDTVLPPMVNPHAPTGGLSEREKLGSSLGTSLVHASEEDREPGSSKFIRALIRRRIANPAAPHPFHASVNPSVPTGGAAAMRALLRGDTAPNADQRAAVDGYASDSSDEDEDYAGPRKGLMRRL
ncbi:MAG TPA: DUF4157 domain-containing protein, partial [Longimicrobium sp.]|nr:DUF4157 domain-containing protein [Longimicrobium sp.]